MNGRELDPFIGLPYSAAFNCADFVAHVQRELYGREVRLPGARDPQAQLRMRETVLDYADPTDSPRDGDLVLMREFGRQRPSHVGLYFEMDHEPWVLHLIERGSQSLCQRVRDLPRFGVRVEGCFAWV